MVMSLTLKMSLFLALLAVCLLFINKIDLALELDGLKQEHARQKAIIDFLLTVSNETLSGNCVDDAKLDEFAKTVGPLSPIHGNDSFMGPFRLRRIKGCLIEIELLDKRS